MEKVSVIIPIFNAAATLHRCLDSVLAQDHTYWELLLVDDGSTDESAEICRTYAAGDSRIRCIENVNSGPSVARNLGLQKATGDYVCFVDADDYARRDYISKLLLPFRTLPVQMSVSGYYEVSHRNPSPRPIHDLKAIKDLCVVESSFFQQKVPYGTTGVICGKMFLGEVIRTHNLKFKCDLFLQEDLIFILKYANMITNVAIIDDYLYYYDRSNPNSLSAVRDEKLLKNSFRAAEYISQIYKHDDASLILTSHRRSAMLTFFDHIAVKEIPVSEKREVIRKQYLRHHQKLTSLPWDSSGMKFTLFLLHYNFVYLYIIFRKILRKERRIRGVI
ncbi:glycosyltransferase family 2 protein [Kaistella solincola]|uniref:glycosyltransferase family 2 protein n=1 Tax=Kaistella solincola TaxID=510955 RepID=UPI000690803F|nr:glycosyltransferase family 2 protein [Kaistella solincola]